AEFRFVRGVAVGHWQPSEVSADCRGRSAGPQEQGWSRNDRSVSYDWICEPRRVRRTQPYGGVMTAIAERRFRLLLILLTLSACQTATAPRPQQRAMDEALPPKVATRAATSSGKPAVVLNTVPGRPGDTAVVTATLNSSGATIAGTQNDIGFD